MNVVLKMKHFLWHRRYAAALACYHNETGFNDVMVHTKGGKLNVEYDRLDDDHYTNIWLSARRKKFLRANLR